MTDEPKKHPRRRRRKKKKVVELHDLRVAPFVFNEAAAVKLLEASPDLTNLMLVRSRLRALNQRRGISNGR